MLTCVDLELRHRWPDRYQFADRVHERMGVHDERAVPNHALLVRRLREPHHRLTVPGSISPTPEGKSIANEALAVGVGVLRVRTSLE